MCKMGEKRSKFEVCDFGAWAMNVVSSVGIIVANKLLMSLQGFAFAFATTLTGFHYSVTSLVGLMSNAAGYSTSKHVPLWELAWFSIAANTSIAGMNFSLILNSVGFYQVHRLQPFTISKLSIIPVVRIMEWILHGKHYSREVKMAVAVVVGGVGVCTVTDVKVNATGFLCACVAVFFTSLQQITIGSLQNKYSIGSFDLLSKTAPFQAISLLLLGPFIDYYLNGKFISSYKPSIGAFVFILVSCSLAVFCNISQHLCIGRFSAVSFQVSGHMKTVCALTMGWLLFDMEMTAKNIIGMVLTVIGMIVYSWAVEVEKQAASAKIIMPSTKEGTQKSLLKDLEFGRDGATLAGVCQVPLTAVLLLFELTKDYRIVLPLLGAVGLSSWVTSGQMRRRDEKSKRKLKQGEGPEIQQPDMLPPGASEVPSNYAPTENESNTSGLCEIESSLCIDESDTETDDLGKKILFQKP